jgi:hypothetical protein
MIFCKNTEGVSLINSGRFQSPMRHNERFQSPAFVVKTHLYKSFLPSPLPLFALFQA